MSAKPLPEEIVRHYSNASTHRFSADLSIGTNQLFVWSIAAAAAKDKLDKDIGIALGANNRSVVHTAAARP